MGQGWVFPARLYLLSMFSVSVLVYRSFRTRCPADHAGARRLMAHDPRISRSLIQTSATVGIQGKFVLDLAVTVVISP